MSSAPSPTHPLLDIDAPSRARDDSAPLSYGAAVDHSQWVPGLPRKDSHHRLALHSVDAVSKSMPGRVVSEIFSSPHLPSAPLVDLRFDGIIKPKPRQNSAMASAATSLSALRRSQEHSFSMEASPSSGIGALQQVIPSLPLEDSYTAPESVEDDVTSETFSSSLFNLLYLAAPAAVTIGFTFCTSIIPLAFVGKLRGERELTGASVGYFLLCIFIQYPMMGLSYAIDTLCSQEYGRRGATSRLGLIFQRGVLINSIILLPLCVGIYFLGPLLVHFYGETVALVAEEFLYFSPLYLYAVLTLVSFSKFLNNQQKAYIPTMALTAGVLVTPFVQYALTVHGIRYTMLGMAITTWLQVFVMLVITSCGKETRETLAIGVWSPAQMFALEDVKTYMSYGLPSSLFVAAEASALDLSILLGASYGEQQGSAWSAIMNTIFLFAALAGGISTSACANIGRCIGANAPSNAKRYVVLAITVVVTIATLDSVVIVVCFRFLLSMFGTSEATIQLASPIRMLIPALHIADAVQYTFQGIFSGLGLNHIGAAILLGSVWLVGIPLAFFFGSYMQLGILGVCLGITIGFWIEAPLMISVATCYLDYHKLCELQMLPLDGDDDGDEEIAFIR